MNYNTSDIKSYHIFLFPFKWDYKSKDGNIDDIPFDKRTDLLAFQTCLNQNNDWEHQKKRPKDFKRGEDYNEWVYFYEFVRQTIYGNEQDEHTYVKQYQFKNLGDAATYEIQIQKRGQPYVLDIDQINLYVHDPGIAILSFHLANRDEATTSEDILNINDFGRRIYPQYLDGKAFSYFSKNQKTTETKAKRTTITPTQKSLLPLSITLRLKNKTITEDFSRYTDIESIKNCPIMLAKHVQHLLGDKFVSEESRVQQKQILVEPVIDDRMFVISYYASTEQMRGLNIFNEAKNTYAYLQDDFWYQYAFIENGNPTCTSKALKRQLIAKHSYDRWLDNSTKNEPPEDDILYGITRYSLVALTGEGEFPRLVVPVHLRTIYYRTLLLALVQRSCILRFSEEIARVSTIRDDKKVVQETQVLYKEYLGFINKIYFREVTAQEQGTQLYNMMHAAMQIERDVKDLDIEIAELHSYTSMLEEKDRNRKLEWITVIGALFLIPSFITGYFGMNIFPASSVAILQEKGFIQGVDMLIMIMMVGGFAYVRLTDKRLKVAIGASILLYLGYMLAYPFF